ncbi:MAG: hypothetical protein ACPLRW_07075 [Moorellales bacterium]
MFGLISVGDYVAYFQPAVAARLWAWAGTSPGIRPVLSLSFGEWRAIMQEPPRPGRAGWLGGKDRSGIR